MQDTQWAVACPLCGVKVPGQTGSIRVVGRDREGVNKGVRVM